MLLAISEIGAVVAQLSDVARRVPGPDTTMDISTAVDRLEHAIAYLHGPGRPTASILRRGLTDLADAADALLKTVSPVDMINPEVAVLQTTARTARELVK